MTTVIIGTYNRGHLLWRSLLAYVKAGVNVIVMDDGSTDDTNIFCKYYINVHYIKMPPKNGEWRDSASFLNQGIKIALHDHKSDYVFITHPEIIVGETTIESAVKLATDKETWVSCKGYYLTPEQQAKIESVHIGESLLNVRKLPGFYGAGNSAEYSGNKDYLPESIEQIPVWQSWIFGGGSRDMWLHFGGLTEFKTWGSVDMDLLNRRHIAGIKTVTPGLPTDLVVHQNHDDPAINTPTPRDMDKCVAALPQYHSKEQALKPELIA